MPVLSFKCYYIPSKRETSTSYSRWCTHGKLCSHPERGQSLGVLWEGKPMELRVTFSLVTSIQTGTRELSTYIVLGIQCNEANVPMLCIYLNGYAYFSFCPNARPLFDVVPGNRERLRCGEVLIGELPHGIQLSSNTCMLCVLLYSRCQENNQIISLRT